MKMAPTFSTAILFSLVHSINFLKLTSATVALHTLFNNQTISLGQTLVSENQVFELGFFHPGKSTNVYLGIWYKATPHIVVWVANRNSPITVSEGVVLAISENGTSLAICRDGTIFWSANLSRRVLLRPILRLLDTGNLIVVEEEEPTAEGYVWQSFDYPTDTWLPGMKIVDDLDSGFQTNLTSWRNPDDPWPGDFVMKIENEGLAEVVIFEGTRKRLRTGKWNLFYFSGIPLYSRAKPRVELKFKEERLIYMLRPYESPAITRATLELSGSAARYVMNPRNDEWNHVFTFPRDQCDYYGSCGPNGICTMGNARRCSCFRGFSPESQNDWDLQDWSGGCGRVTPLNCEGGDGFVEVRGVKYPDMLRYWLNWTISLEECRDECLKNCSCTAYANPYITNGGSGCLMWYGELLDIREVPGVDIKQIIYIRVPVSEQDFSSGIEEEEEKKGHMKLILISIVTGVIVSSFINGGTALLARRKKRALKRNNEDIDLPLIKMATILEATNNFSPENMIGRGGFGPVYMGRLSEGEEIAAKRLSITSGQGLEEFKNEVVLIAKLQHRNLVRLLGCCIEGEEMVLIYEYLQNKSLDYFVFDPNRRTLLTWPKRFHIIMGIAKGLLYLHHDSRLKIIHRDLKPCNILLDANLNPKISDFGFARTFEEDQLASRTRRVVGTYGYMAPEYAFQGKFSVKSDIYSLGVVLLEIISGTKIGGFEHNGHHHSLMGHAWLLWKEKRVMELMDGCLSDTYIESQVKRCINVALLCVQNSAEDRPIMASVVLMLATEGAILPQPNEPGFFVGAASFKPLHSYNNSNNTSLAITDLEAR